MKSVTGLVIAASMSCVSCSGGSSKTGLLLPSLSEPGACAGAVLARHGQVVSQQAVGTGSADASRAVFDIGSAAKSVTAAAVVLLAQNHELSLHATIARYLPGVPDDKRDITLEQLLTHTSGLPTDFTSDQTLISRDDAVHDILALPREASGPFRYSNAGYTLLAAVVEHVAGMPFKQFVSQRLLQPSGMLSTGWYGASAPTGTRPVDGHVAGRNTGPAGSQAPGSWATLGSGGMTSTAVDLIRWLFAVNTGPLLSEQSRIEMFRGRVALGAPGAEAAYGFVVGTTSGGQPIRLIGGDTDYGFTSDLRYYPRKDVATVALSCSDTTPAVDLGHALEATALQT